jgi:hypothetical protein
MSGGLENKLKQTKLTKEYNVKDQRPSRAGERVVRKADREASLCCAPRYVRGGGEDTEEELDQHTQKEEKRI